MSFVIEFIVYNEFGLYNSNKRDYTNYCISINSSKSEIPNRFCNVNYKKITHEIKFIFIIQRKISQVINEYVNQLVQDNLLTVRYIDDDNQLTEVNKRINLFVDKINLIFTCKDEFSISEKYLVDKFVELFNEVMISNYVVIAKHEDIIQRYAADLKNYSIDIQTISNNLKDYDIIA